MTKKAIFLLLLCLGTATPAFSQALSGDFGVNNALHWELTEYGDGLKLSITGTGAIPDFSPGSTNQLWLYYKSGIQSVSIGNGVTRIGNYFCEGATNLTGTLSIPNSVTSIGNSAFSGCSKLTGTLSIPNSVTSIGIAAFNWCSKLTSLTISNSVTSIGSSAFAYCSGLTSLTIPNSVTSIGSYAFEYCSGLTSLTIPNSVTSIGNSAFYGCSGLTSLTIPNSVTSIGYTAFYNCSGLTSVILEDGTKTLSFVADLTYSSTFHNCPIDSLYLGRNINYGQYDLRTPFDNMPLTSLTIGNSVTSICDEAFPNCKYLTTLTIPNSVTSIGNGAFYGCSSLKKVVTQAINPPSLGSYNFSMSGDTLYCPTNLAKIAYESITAWQNAFSVIMVGDGGITGIETVNRSDISVFAVQGGISVTTPQREQVSVFSLAGQQVFQAEIVGRRDIILPKGIYIVKINNESEKIIVK